MDDFWTLLILSLFLHPFVCVLCMYVPNNPYYILGSLLLQRIPHPTTRSRITPFFSSHPIPSLPYHAIQSHKANPHNPYSTLV